MQPNIVVVGDILDGWMLVEQNAVPPMPVSKRTVQTFRRRNYLTRRGPPFSLSKEGIRAAKELCPGVLGG